LKILTLSLYYDKIIAGLKMNGLENKAWKKKIYGLRLGIGEIKIKHYPRSPARFLLLPFWLIWIYYNFTGDWNTGLGYLIVGMVGVIAFEIDRLNQKKRVHYIINNIIHGGRESLPNINKCITILIQNQKKQFSEELNILINYLRKKRDDRVE